MTQRYSDGTVTVSNGSTTVTGSGTAWEVALVAGGILFVGTDAAVIEEVVSDTELTLTRPWTGDPATNASYDIVLDSAEAARTIIANRQMADIVARINAGIALDDIGAIGTLAQRDDYDDEPQGFIFAVTDDASGDLVVYVKASATNGDWAGPFAWRGPAGQQGPQGPRGDGFDYTGQGTPSDSIGNDGDTYLDTDTGDTYVKAGGTWGSPSGSIRGPQGVDGADPGIFMTFDTATADADPGAGNFRADDSDLSAATELYVSKTNRGGSDVSAWLLALDDSTSAVKGTLTITDPDSEAQTTFDVTGVTDATGYVKVTVSNHGGATAYPDETPIGLMFSRTGDAGTGAVSSVNGKSGAVTLVPGDLGAGTVGEGVFEADTQSDAWTALGEVPEANLTNALAAALSYTGLLYDGVNNSIDIDQAGAGFKGLVDPDGAGNSGTFPPETASFWSISVENQHSTDPLIRTVMRAVKYSNSDPDATEQHVSVWARYRGNTTWGPWSRVLTSGNLPQATQTEMEAGTETAPRSMSPANVAQAIAALASGGGGGGRNLLINPLGTINQRGYASGAATSGANEYAIDRWRVVVSGQSMAFTVNNGYATIVAPAGGVEQVIDGGAILSGDYVLSWEGTATATVNGNAVTNGGKVTLTGGSDVTVRFSGGTFAKPLLEPGDTPTDFDARHPAQELLLCQRYYEEGTNLNGIYVQYNASYCRFNRVGFKATKRVSPTMTVSGTRVGGGSGTIDSLFNPNEDADGFAPIFSISGGASGNVFVGTITFTADAEL
ncbi:hypothetical protein [Oricola thermophila]|uniref:Tail fiber protein n=1 Tax=Oricola thermophila TaxID=2742145 RepID=A0A6N1VDA9_9HYPH|nr:hypothetical protein [Oricola thermophila]QKV18708.1 hypothetical protein HTY61_09730 [Oricola thermophila]